MWQQALADRAVAPWQSLLPVDEKAEHGRQVPGSDGCEPRSFRAWRRGEWRVSLRLTGDAAKRLPGELRAACARGDTMSKSSFATLEKQVLAFPQLKGRLKMLV
jgi:hypothetical protein